MKETEEEFEEYRTSDGFYKPLGDELWDFYEKMVAKMTKDPTWTSYEPGKIELRSKIKIGMGHMGDQPGDLVRVESLYQDPEG